MGDRITQLAADDIAAFAAGCAVFGTGGGGSVGIAQLTTTRALEENGPVRVLQVDDIGDDDLVVCISGIGAPTVGIEMLPSATQAQSLLREVENFAGRPVTALMAAEIGGTNGVGPAGWASRFGTAVLDGDGMGRAFPRSNMISMNAAGVPCDFAVMADVVGNVITIKTVDLEWLERHARAITVASGSLCLGAHYPLTGRTIRGAVVEGTVTRALEVGRALLDSPDPVAGVAESLGAKTLIRGKISDLERRTEAGFAHGVVTVTGTGADRGRTQRIDIQNENLLVTEDGAVRAMVPDLITIVDDETGHAISTELLGYGQRIAVLAWPCDPLWRSDRGQELVGPAAFGFDLPYVPVEELHTGGAA